MTSSYTEYLKTLDEDDRLEASMWLLAYVSVMHPYVMSEAIRFHKEEKS